MFVFRLSFALTLGLFTLSTPFSTRAIAEEETPGRVAWPSEPEHRVVRDVRYHRVEGVDPDLLSLDLYIPTTTVDTPRPVLIMIHGGGWRVGDKRGRNVVGAKMRHFVERGYIFASINYRLSKPQGDAAPVRHPIHVEDCARAVAFLHDNIAKYNGDPTQLHLMGHSAGAHLAGLLGTNERFLKTHDKTLGILKTNVLLDTAALDLTNATRSAGFFLRSLYSNAFGADPERLRDASPALHVAKGKSIPPTLLFYSGDRMQLDIAGPAFANSLTKAGSPSQAIDTVSLSHAEINARVGLVNEPMTALIMRLHAGEDASKFPTVLPDTTAADR